MSTDSPAKVQSGIRRGSRAVRPPFEWWTPKQGIKGEKGHRRLSERLLRQGPLGGACRGPFSTGQSTPCRTCREGRSSSHVKCRGRCTAAQHISGLQAQSIAQVGLMDNRRRTARRKHSGLPTITAGPGGTTRVSDIGRGGRNGCGRKDHGGDDLRTGMIPLGGTPPRRRDRRTIALPRQATKARS